jgi:hypothetical protein
VAFFERGDHVGAVYLQLAGGSASRQADSITLLVLLGVQMRMHCSGPRSGRLRARGSAAVA